MARRVDRCVIGRLMGFVELMVDRIQKGISGEEVLRQVLQKYKTPCTQASKLSLIKRRALDAGVHHPAYQASMREFNEAVRRARPLAAPCQDAFNEFRSAPLHTQVRLQSKHRKRAFCFDNEGIDDAFRKLELLHPELAKLRPPQEVHDACDRALYERKMMVSEKMFVVEDASALHAKLRQHLNVDGVRFTRSGTLLALLGLSGRRATEIVSPNSEFRLTTHSHVVRFRGQLKKLGGDASYNVPLLVPASEWLTALSRYRAAQDSRALHMNASELETSFGSAPREFLTRHFPEAGHVHNLRGIYAAMVCVAYDIGLFRPQRVIFEIMGHEKMGDTQFHYEQVKLKGVGALASSMGNFADVSRATTLEEEVDHT